MYTYKSSGDSYVVPPVPIPNTVVKHINAESTWLETAWEDRELPVTWRVGQVVKTPPSHGGFKGSNPLRVTNMTH